MRNKFLLLTAAYSIVSCSTSLNNLELKAKADARLKTLEENINTLGSNGVKFAFNGWKAKGPYDMDEQETLEANLVEAINNMPAGNNRSTILKNWNCFVEARKAYNKSK